MAEARDKIETFKNILLELQVSNETLDKINTNTLNASEMGIESLVANKSSSGSSGSDSILKCLENIAQDSLRMVNSLNAISQILSDTLEMNKSKNLADEEARLEAAKNKEKIVKMDPKEKKSGSGMGLLGIAALIGGLVFGFVKGLFDRLGKIFNNYEKLKKVLNLEGFTNGIGSFFKNMFASLKGTISELMPKWLKEFVKDIRVTYRYLRAEFYAIKSAFSGFMKLFSGLPKLGAISRIGTIFKSLGQFLGIFSKLGAIFKAAAGFGRAIPVVGEFLMLAEAVWDGVAAYLKTGSVAEGFKAASMSIINGIGSALELIKRFASWIAGAVGLKSIEDALDSIDLSLLLKVLVERLISFGQDCFQTLFEPFFDAFNDISKAFGDGDILKGLWATLRAALDIGLGSFVNGIKGIVSSAASWFGASKETIAKIDAFTVRGLLGGTSTKTESNAPKEGYFSMDGIRRRMAELSALGKKTTEKAENKKEKVEDEIDNMVDPITAFYDQLLTAYKEHADGTVPSGVTPANANTIGAQIDALSTDTKEQNDNAYYAARGGSAAPSMSKSSNVSNSNNSNVVTVNSSPMPDRIDFTLRSMYAR